MPPRCFGRALGALILLFAAVATGEAHQMNLTTAHLVAADGEVRVSVALKGSDVERATGLVVTDRRTGAVDERLLAPAHGGIEAYVLGRLSLRGADRTPCSPGPAATSADEDGIVVAATWDCRAAAGPLTYRSDLLLDIDPAARQIVLVGGENGTGESSQALLDAESPETTIDAGHPPGRAAVATRYVAAGIEHIFTGYDHIAFLIAVVLWATRLWPVLKTVTAFTAAHSITLSLAALDVVRIPSAIVEPAIAASILYVAIENFISRDIDRKWRVTFVLGLAHGFGFAGALQEFGLPRDALVVALGAFNVGVELGQIAVVSLIFLGMMAVDRFAAGSRKGEPTRSAGAVYAVSSVVGVLGAYWLVERLFFGGS